MAPGIYQAQSLGVKGDFLVLEVSGYNSHFEAGKNTLWLEKKGLAPVAATAVDVANSNSLSVQFPREQFSQAASYNLWLHNEKDKTLFLPQAVYLNPEQLLPDSLQQSTANFKREDFIEARKGFEIPYKSILYETIRNLNFHVCMWFVLLVLMTVSLVYAIKTLNRGYGQSDLKSLEAARVGLYFALLGILSGSVWAKYTWGAWWVNDPKLNGAALTVLVYAAYLVLRQSVNDPEKRARLAAVYNIFAFVLMIVFIQILPRLTDSLHPGNGGNPAFSQYDLDNNLRAVFYPATLGWILLGIWIWNLKTRISLLTFKNVYEA
ncbi:MAG: cytochrome c biogenesis protein CcsA [Luteibaculum sp.]